MHNKLIFMSLIICVSTINGMEFNNFQEYEFLPVEIQYLIIYFATNHLAVKKPKEATQIIRNLSKTSNNINAIINTPKFNVNLINNLAHTYKCSHQSIAQFLSTQQSKKQLALQHQLKQLCRIEQDINLLPKLNELVSQGIDLEFTYNYYPCHKTPLMIAMDYDNNMFEYLITHGANINGCNLHGATVLHLAVSKPVNKYYIARLATSPAIAINQQNCRGENALLHCLTRKNLPTNRLLTAIVRTLLKAGIDPENSNRRQKELNPLTAAQDLGYQPIISILEKALEEKHSLTQ